MRLGVTIFIDLKPGADDPPQASTICRFRNCLAGVAMDQQQLALANGELKDPGRKERGARGAIIEVFTVSGGAQLRRDVG